MQGLYSDALSWHDLEHTKTPTCNWLAESVQMPLDPAYVSKLDAREKETDSRDVILGGIKCGSDSQQSTGNREGVTEHQDADAMQ